MLPVSSWHFGTSRCCGDSDRSCNHCGLCDPAAALCTLEAACKCGICLSVLPSALSRLPATEKVPFMAALCTLKTARNKKICLLMLPSERLQLRNLPFEFAFLCRWDVLEWKFPDWAAVTGPAINILKGAILAADRVMTVSQVCS